MKLAVLSRGAYAAMVFAFFQSFSTAALAQDDDSPWDDVEAVEAAPASGAIPVEDSGDTAAAPVEKIEDATQLDTLEVTGSRIKRTDYETESPVLVIGREEIERTGMVSIGDILQNLPQAGAALSRSFNNGGNGDTNIDLRNLGANRVLVLVNGRRWVTTTSSFNTGAVDLNTIPISIIDSIEILKDGASAIYGSDAIAGVVNIKTRRDYVGAEFRGHVEATDSGDGLSRLISFSSGAVTGKTSVFFDISHVRQGELLSGDREQSAVPTFGIPNISRGSRFMEYGNFIFVPTSDNAQAINAAGGFPQGGVSSPCPDITTGLQVDPNIPVTPLPAGSFLSLCDLTLDHAQFDNNGVQNYVRVDLNEDAYNYAPVNYLMTPSERTSIYGQLSHQITSNVRLSSEVLYNIRTSTQQLAETPDGLGDLLGFHPFDVGYVADDNPYNPTNPQSPYYIPGAQAQDIGLADSGSGLIGLGAVLRRFRELGPRIFTQDVHTMRIGGGFEGDLDLLSRGFFWDSGFAFGENNLRDINFNLINNQRLALASGPLADCVGVTDPDGDTVTPRRLDAFNCVPMDWFGGPGSVTPEMADYIRYDAIDVSKQKQQIIYANASTEVPELDGILAGPMGVAFGAEYRRDDFAAQPDPLKVAELSSTNSVGPTQGGYEVAEFYTETRLPLFADLPYLESLELSLAGRYSKYTSFGDNISGKAGIVYKPYDDLLVRSTYSTAFRAPAVTDLFLGQAVSFPFVDDPCAEPEEDRTATVNENCGDAAGNSQISSQLPTIFGGNPDLDPETATTLSLGFVWSPEFIRDFNLYADWYRVDADDFILPLGPDQILQLCYESPNPSYCDAVERNSTGQITRINAVFQNFNRFLVEGIDVNWDWILPLPEGFDNYGQFKWTFDAAYVMKLDVFSPNADGGEDVNHFAGEQFGGFGGAPRLKINTGIDWTQGPWDVTWNVRFISSMWEQCDDGRSDLGAQGEVLENPVPVGSFADFGLCSDPNSTRYVNFVDSDGDGTIDNPDEKIAANKLDPIFYNDIQASYTLHQWNTKIGFGVINLLDQDPPQAVSAFSDSYDKATYDPWGSRTPYVRVQVAF